jgi:hypothetical protein
MPANLTPEYKAAELAFRKARDLPERLERLREMLRVMLYEDIHFQLVDLPAISPEHPVSWLASALQTPTHVCSTHAGSTRSMTRG